MRLPYVQFTFTRSCLFAGDVNMLVQLLVCVFLVLKYGTNHFALPVTEETEGNTVVFCFGSKLDKQSVKVTESGQFQTHFWSVITLLLA